MAASPLNAPALTPAIVLPGGWIALDEGDRPGTTTLPCLSFASDLICRVAFGIGALVGSVMLAFFVRQAATAQTRARARR